MQATYIKALEQRAKWTQFADLYIASLKEDRAKREHWGRTCSHPTHYSRTLRMYKESLTRGDTFYMDRNFCNLVDYARQTVPDDLFFEESWMQTKAGFMWLEDPFDCPVPPDMTGLLELTGRAAPMIHAVSWYPSVGGGTTFLTYQGFAKMPWIGNRAGFGCWTYFTLEQNDRLIDRLQEFEKTVIDLDAPGFGQYVPGKQTNMKHEIRWVYTAMHLMSQRLAVTSEHRTTPLARSMAQRKKLPIGEFLKVVTLRRKQPETYHEGDKRSVEWSCRWLVDCHWRNQWYPSEQIHRQIYIDPYMKGPEDKPLKQPTHTLFKAQR